ncbi:hypothetical protein MA16_Dca014801 [Dendrobium catenatum]|uniref:Isochorismatase-like domain-containing protein n=1 Tax=Dendrobium catenatum TaxID=906689 RepID=A0A2I0W692_9ASPA|nr:hypothetical protein MA16_Dca014801 [Dendrobium catenatum]
MAVAAAGKWRETAMLVIDMQNDFILPGGPMHVAGGQAIVPEVIRAVSVARDRGIYVIWVNRCRAIISFSFSISPFGLHCLFLFQIESSRIPQERE